MIRYKKSYGGWSESGPSSASYGAIGSDKVTIHGDAPTDAKTDPGYRPSARVSMTLGRLYEVEPGQDPSALGRNIYTRKGEQQVLFDHSPSIIEVAFSDHRLRGSAAMNLIGMAYNDAKKLGYGLTYDHSLSPHSSALAKLGLDMGVVSPNPHNEDASQTNSIAFDGAHRHTETTPKWMGEKYSPLGEDVDPAELAEARNTVRGFVRSRRTLGKQFNAPVPSEAPEQLHLSPELEDAHNNPKPLRYVPSNTEWEIVRNSRSSRIIRGIDPGAEAARNAARNAAQSRLGYPRNPPATTEEHTARRDYWLETARQAQETLNNPSLFRNHEFARTRLRVAQRIAQDAQRRIDQLSQQDDQWGQYYE